MKYYIAKKGRTLIEIISLLRKYKISYSVGKNINDDTDVYTSLISKEALDELRAIFNNNYESDAYGVHDTIRDSCKFGTLRNNLVLVNIDDYCDVCVVDAGDVLGNHIFNKQSSVQDVFVNIDSEWYPTIDMIYTISGGTQRVVSKRLSDRDSVHTIIAAYSKYVNDKLEIPMDLVAAPIKDLVQLAIEVQHINNKYHQQEAGISFDIDKYSKPHNNNCNVLYDLGEVVIQTNEVLNGAFLADLFSTELEIDKVGMVQYSITDHIGDYYQIYSYDCGDNRTGAERIINEFYNKEHKGPYYEIDAVTQSDMKINAVVAYKEELSYQEGKTKSTEVISADKNLVATVTTLYQEGKEHLDVPVTDDMELLDCTISINNRNGVCIVKSTDREAVVPIESLYQLQAHVTKAIKLQEGVTNYLLHKPVQDAEIIASEILRYPGLANSPAACLINIAVMDSKTIVIATQLKVTEDGEAYNNTSVTNGLEGIKEAVEQQYNLSGNIYWFEHYPVGVGASKSMEILKEVKFKENGSPTWNDTYDLCIEASAEGFYNNFGLRVKDILKNYPQ